MKHIKFILIVVILCAGLYRADARLNVFYSYNRITPKIGVGYALNKTFNVDVSIYDVIFFENFSPEFTVRANFLQKEKYNLYAGTGVAFRTVYSFYSIIFPVGVEVKPFDSCPKLSFKFDFNVMIGFERDPSCFLPGFAVCYSLW